MRTSSKRILSIGLSLLFFIGILLVYGTLIRPAMSAVGKTRSLVASKETLFNNQKNAVAQVQDLVSQYQNAATLQETVGLAIPIGSHVTDAMGQLYAVAKQASVSLQSFGVHSLPLEVTKEALVKRLGKIEVNLAVQGSYENIKTFLRYLETNVRVATITSMQFTPLASGFIQNIAQGSDNYTLNLVVQLYYQE